MRAHHLYFLGVIREGSTHLVALELVVPPDREGRSIGIDRP